MHNAGSLHVPLDLFTITVCVKQRVWLIVDVSTQEWLSNALQ